MRGLPWDAVARRYVEGADPEPAETFGPLHLYGVHEAVRVGIDHAAAGSDKTAYLVADTYKRFPKMMSRLYEADNDNRGPYISTYTGRFFPFSPRPEDVRIEDIAHGLAMSCRYTGAVKQFYSTAEHSVHIARWLTRNGYHPQVALAGLLHDAPEALSGFGDTARPSKVKAPLIKETEERIYREAIAPAFGLSDRGLPEAVHGADSRIIADEMRQNMHEVDPKYDDPLGIELQYWSPDEAETEFLLEFVRLIDARRAAA